MKPETEVPPGERVLIIVGRLGKTLVRDLDEVYIPRFLKRYEGRKEITDPITLAQYQERDTSQDDAYYTLYAYADIEKGRQYDQLVNRDPTVEPMKIGCTIDHIVYESWFPTSSIEHGHKHILFLRFVGGPPACIQTYDSWDQLVGAKWTFGLTDSAGTPR